jgi:NADH:ubiquinone oxidoreductase subunit 3 (subunit A)
MKGFVLVVVLVALSSIVNCQRPQRTKLVSGGIYRLESQHDGAVRPTLNKTVLISSYCRIRMIFIFFLVKTVFDSLREWESRYEAGHWRSRSRTKMDFYSKW